MKSVYDIFLYFPKITVFGTKTVNLRHVVFDNKKQVWYTKIDLLRKYKKCITGGRLRGRSADVKIDNEVDKVDKYEYNLKLEEIDKLVDQGDYSEAANLADTIDWRRVRNVRTLCLISEIYEASGRLEDSKNLLVRAYRRSPVGRSVLYRLVEVTTRLQQFDEAIEYYSEYVQAAPHDNNRYILKYQIYKGRGSSTEELITILEEYLGQEYTERWAYELARLYQQAGQMQKCLAACDDLVLWFHSGTYVLKALELKKRYATLTPRQQQIYEEELQRQAESDLDVPEDTEEDNVIRNVESTDGEVIAETIMAETEKEIAGQVAAHKAEMEKGAAIESQEEAAAGPESQTAAAAAEPEEAKDLQVELAKSMRKIISGVVKRTEVEEEDIPASVEPGLQRVQKLEMPEVEEQVAGQLSIDDILLSMGDKGKRIADAVIGEEEAAADEAAQAGSEEQAEEEPQTEPDLDVYEAPLSESGQSDNVRLAAEPKRTPHRRLAEAAADDLTDAQREALRYTNHPEKLLRNKSSLPTYAEEQAEQDDLGKTRRIATKEELLEAAKKEILSEKTIRIPTEEIYKNMSENVPDDPDDEQEPDTYDEQELPFEEEVQEEPDMRERLGDFSEEEYYEDEYLTIPSHLRNLFSGFTEVEGLEDQIANAIIQAESKGDDRTSRSGNILIFGAHGSGKTTLAMNLAKAIAQDKGSQVMKMAKIYAADLNRKDIAATVAKIAGGTLIIEEAGDLEPGTVEQLTTAMEFRTDGLIVILEDEQQYIHELLMRHPRFTMKFTAQIYIPEYTVEELAMFGQIYANAQDYVIGEDAMEEFCQKITAAGEEGAVVAISDVIEIVSKAIGRSNKFFRKVTMGKKRYDENDYIILFPKDFR